MIMMMRIFSKRGCIVNIRDRDGVSLWDGTLGMHWVGSCGSIELRGFLVLEMHSDGVSWILRRFLLLLYNTLIK